MVRTLRRWGVLSFVLLISACVSQPPIVADPPKSLDDAPQELLLEEEYGRAMMRPQAEGLPASADIHRDQKFTGPMDTSANDGSDEGFFDVVADVLAAPFRAVGWLLQAVF